MANDRPVATVALKVNGTDIDPDVHRRLTLVHVTESVQLPDIFTIRIRDPHFETLDSAVFAMGTEVEIAFGSTDEATVVTKGEVTSIGVEEGSTGRHELVLQGLDSSHRLHREPKRRTFVQMTDSDIAEEIARGAGLESDIESTTEVHDYVIQASETDYSLLSRRAALIGYELWVAEGTMFFKEAAESQSTPPAMKWGDNLIHFRVRFSASDRCDEVTVQGWDPVRKQAVVGQASERDPGSTATAVTELSDEAVAAFGSVSRFAGHFPVTTQSEADALARSLLNRASGTEVIARGEAFGDPNIAAGSSVEIAGVGERLTGEYRLTSVEHIYKGDEAYTTKFVSGSKESAGLVDLLRGGTAKGWGSLVFGAVTNVDDEDKLGRVKVKFVDLEDTESHWAPVVSAGAGADRGIQWLPEVGDTVLVGFEHDDHRRPIVLGGLWNQTDSPPSADAAAGGEVKTRTLKSRNGHILEFTDESDGKISLTMGDAKSGLTMTKAECGLVGEQALKIDGQDITITASGKLKIEAAQVEIDSKGPVKVAGKPIQLN